MRRIILSALFSALILIGIYLYQAYEFSGQNLKIVFCDVGQGDAIFIRTPDGSDILVDAGPNNGKVLECLSRNMPFWDRELELVFATHPDADHIGGFISVLSNYTVKSFNSVAAEKDTAVFVQIQETIKRENVPYREISTGSNFKSPDGVSILTKWPDKNFESSDSNDYSLVQLLQYKDFKLLLTGDIPYQILDKLNLPSHISIFKIPHHGSKTGVDDETFKRFTFDLVAISVGKNNRYHHPHPSVITLLKKYNLLYKRTDLVGAIDVISNGSDWKFN